MEFTSPLEQEGALHTMTTEWAGDPEREGSTMFFARVKLFAERRGNGDGRSCLAPCGGALQQHVEIGLGAGASETCCC